MAEGGPGLDRPPASGSAGWQSKIGPLPAYAWVLVAAAGGVAFLLWTRRGGSDGGSNTAGFVAPSSEEEGLSDEQYQTLLSQLRDLQGEDSVPVTTTPPATTTGKISDTIGQKDLVPAPGSKRGYGWYKAVKGDTAAKVAAKYNISVPTFLLFNGGRSGFPIGQWLKVRVNSNPLYGFTGK